MYISEYYTELNYNTASSFITDLYLREFDERLAAIGFLEEEDSEDGYSNQMLPLA